MGSSVNLPYSDLPPGATVVPSDSAPSYTDLPQGATLVKPGQTRLTHYLTEPSQQALAPQEEQTGWDTVVNAVKGAAAPIVNMILHPLDTARSMGEQIVVSGVSPNGYPIFAPTGHPAVDEANRRMQELAQANALSSGNTMRERYPGYVVGTLAAPILGEAARVAAPELGQAASAARDIAAEHGPTIGGAAGAVYGFTKGGLAGALAGGFTGERVGRMVQRFAQRPAPSEEAPAPVPTETAPTPAPGEEAPSQAKPSQTISDDAIARGLGYKDATQARQRLGDPVFDQVADKVRTAPSREGGGGRAPTAAPARTPASDLSFQAEWNPKTQKWEDVLPSTAEPASRMVPELPKDLNDALDDNAMLQKFRQDLQHEGSGVELEKEQARYMGELPSGGATKGMETTAAGAALKSQEPPAWTQMRNWTERDTQRVLGGDYRDPRALDGSKNIYVSEEQYRNALKRWQQKTGQPPPSEENQ